MDILVIKHQKDTHPCGVYILEAKSGRDRQTIHKIRSLNLCEIKRRYCYGKGGRQEEKQKK